MPNKPNNLISGNAESVSYIFPKSEEIIIPRSDLQIQLQKFRRAIGSSFSIFDFLAVISLWSPVFANAFAPMLEMSAGEVRVGYIVLAIILTVIILWNKVVYIILNLFRSTNVSSDPEKMSQIILDQCQPKKEK